MEEGRSVTRMGQRTVRNSSEGNRENLLNLKDNACQVKIGFPVPRKSCTYAFDPQSLLCSDYYLRPPLETVNRCLLGHGLLAIANPWDSHAIALLCSGVPLLLVNEIIVKILRITREVNKAMELL